MSDTQQQSTEPANVDDRGPQCAWTGEHPGGRYYVLQSSEGQQLVSEEALRGTAVAEDTEQLRKAVRDLQRRVSQLEGGAPAAAARKVPSQRPVKEK